VNRDIYASLQTWSSSPARKPLVLRGARQTGKTHALRWLGDAYYKNTVYLNFEKDPLLASLFEETLSPEVLVSKITGHTGSGIVPHDTLLIFDEVQECNAALNSLKYFHEDAPQIHVAAAGSLLGIKMSKGRSFPVGKVDFLDLFPLTFSEFLGASKESRLRNLLVDKNDLVPLANAFHQKLLALLVDYFIVGGMPEVVAGYVAGDGLARARHVQEAILKAYESDFAKHAPSTDIPKLSLVWESLPRHLACENKRFIFSALRRGARGREYEAALQWLHDAGLIHFCLRTTKAAMPLSAYEEHDIFKVYALDVGLLGALANLPFEILFRGSRVFSEFNGAFIENYVAQQLVAAGKRLNYWESAGSAEVDFVFQTSEAIVPLEVKAGINVKSKSLRSFRDKHPDLARACRANLLAFQQSGGIENYPLYAVGQCFR